MVRIRLSRVGRKNAPKYRVTVADSRAHVTKRFIEVVGFYNPLARGQDPKLKLDMDKINAWIQKGAQPTERVQHLIKTYTSK
jgi:small subunit ribosomal protein S16